MLRDYLDELFFHCPLLASVATLLSTANPAGVLLRATEVAACDDFSVPTGPFHGGFHLNMHGISMELKFIALLLALYQSTIPGGTETVLHGCYIAIHRIQIQLHACLIHKTKCLLTLDVNRCPYGRLRNTSRILG